MEIQQSPLFAQYIKQLGWKTEKIGPYTLFIKSFFFIGAIGKLQRTTTLPSYKTIIALIKKHRIKLLVVEPDHSISSKALSLFTTMLKPHVRISTAHYLSTKTIRVDLTSLDDDIFKKFSEAKRRAVRRSTTLGVSIKESTNIQELIQLKAKTAGLFGGLTTYGMKELWSCFAPTNASILLAYAKDREIMGGVLLLYWDHCAYYWIAGATKAGKKAFSPTLLVWEALKIAKKNRCETFDFVGVWDERLPKENLVWKGFTKFKEGFGGSSLYYPLINI
ncbi:MAG: peptidoglycan bridge formation glycyltransferase FemA/FemB family protein [Patescibacteria group bacterium]